MWIHVSVCMPVCVYICIQTFACLPFLNVYDSPIVSLRQKHFALGHVRHISHLYSLLTQLQQIIEQKCDYSILIGRQFILPALTF